MIRSMSASTKGRTEQEEQYHNQRYKKDPRRKLSGFYQITKTVKQDYDRTIYRNCQGSKILELGCGTGAHAVEMASRGAKLTAVDISGYAIEKAKERAAKENLDIDFQVMNAEKLKLDDNCFDLICGTGILHHLDLNRAITETKRVMKNEGTAVFVEPLGHNVLINWFRILTPSLRTKHEHPLKSKDLKYMKNRFRYVNVKYYYLFSLLAILFKRFAAFARVLKRLEYLDNKIFHLLPFSKRYAWQILITLRK
jgi:ubiquinone/menaquinone biosynthesis C-methylase UbiE